VADFTAQQRRDMAAAGQAMMGGITNRAELENAIRMVGQVPEEARAMVRRFIIRSAARLGLSEIIPAAWNADGSLKTP
jgi:hypothetical protein